MEFEILDKMNFIDEFNVKGGHVVPKYFKNKRYWILMPPFFIIALLVYIFLPHNYRYLSFLVIIIFWIVYWRWNKREDHKNSE